MDGRKRLRDSWRTSRRPSKLLSMVEMASASLRSSGRLEAAYLRGNFGVRLVGLAADDEEASGRSMVFDEAGEPADGIIDALSGYHSPDLEDDALVGG